MRASRLVDDATRGGGDMATLLARICEPPPPEDEAGGAEAP